MVAGQAYMYVLVYSVWRMLLYTAVCCNDADYWFRLFYHNITLHGNLQIESID